MIPPPLPSRFRNVPIILFQCENKRQGGGLCTTVALALLLVQIFHDFPTFIHHVSLVIFSHSNSELGMDAICAGGTVWQQWTVSRGGGQPECVHSGLSNYPGPLRTTTQKPQSFKDHHKKTYMLSLWQNFRGVVHMSQWEVFLDVWYMTKNRLWWSLKDWGNSTLASDNSTLLYSQHSTFLAILTGHWLTSGGGQAKLGARLFFGEKFLFWRIGGPYRPGL